MRKIVKSVVVAGFLLGTTSSLAIDCLNSGIKTYTGDGNAVTNGGITSECYFNWWSENKHPVLFISSNSRVGAAWGTLDKFTPNLVDTTNIENFGKGDLKYKIVEGSCGTSFPGGTDIPFIDFVANTTFCAYYELNDHLITIEGVTGNSASDGWVSSSSVKYYPLNTATTLSTLTSVPTTDKADAVTPFASLTLIDADSTAFTATLSLDDANKGALSSTSIVSGDLETVQAAIQAVTFTPTENRKAVGESETATITLTVTADGVDATTINTVVTTSMNDAPVLETNTGLSVGKGSTSEIDNTMLKTTDVDTSDIITYTLTSALSGTLKNDDSDLSVNDTFTQSDIDSSSISYTAGSEVGSDSFSFSVTDGNSDPITGTFDISIINPTVSYTNTLKESADNDGSVDGSIVMTLIGDTFATCGTISECVSASNISSGLSASFLKDSDTQITMTLSGYAETHTSSENVSDLNISFTDEAFTSNTAEDIIDATKDDLTLNFIDAVITDLTADRWNMISFGKYDLDTTSIDSSYLTEGKNIKVYRDGQWVLNPTNLKANEGVWIHPTDTSIAFSGTATTDNNFSDKTAQLDYYKTLEPQKWHLVSVQHAMEWTDLTKSNITPNGCNGYSMVQYYDPMTDSYNTTTNIPAGAAIFIRHMCVGGES